MMMLQQPFTQGTGLVVASGVARYAVVAVNITLFKQSLATAQGVCARRHVMHPQQHEHLLHGELAVVLRGDSALTLLYIRFPCLICKQEGPTLLYIHCLGCKNEEGTDLLLALRGSGLALRGNREVQQRGMHIIGPGFIAVRIIAVRIVLLVLVLLVLVLLGLVSETVVARVAGCHEMMSIWMEE